MEKNEEKDAVKGAVYKCTCVEEREKEMSRVCGGERKQGGVCSF